MNRIENLKSSEKPIISKILFLAIALALIVSLGVSQVQAKATAVVTNFSQPTDLTVYVPCAALGAGEYVQLSGSLHVLFVTTIDNQGGFHSKFHVQPQGISGTGLTTGAKYQATGETQGTFNGDLVSGQPSEQTFVNNFKIVGQGPGNNFMSHETFHITVNPDGTVTAFVDNFSVECRIPNYP